MFLSLVFAPRRSLFSNTQRVEQEFPDGRWETPQRAEIRPPTPVEL